MFIYKCHYLSVIMKLKTLKLMMMVSVILCWIVLGVSSYNLVKGNATGEGPSIAGSAIESVAAVEDNRSFVERILSDEVPERHSPCDRVKESQIFVTNERIVIEFQDAEWATFTDSNSMDPVLDIGANALEYVPKSADEICLGDIVSYHSQYAEGVIIHRIVEIGYDNVGWYATLKGDNLEYNDPEKVRFDKIERVVIGIIY
jgi:hypothetical protein